jgi:site-specific recombinase XerC
MQSGNDIKTVQELLGHQDLNTTAIYLHADAARGVSPMDVLARPVPPIPQITF